MRRTARPCGGEARASTEHQRAEESATCVGFGSAASAASRVVPPVSTSARVQAGAAGARDVDLQQIADRQHAARAEPVAGRLVHRRLGLADHDVGGPAGGVSIAASTAPLAGHGAVLHRERAVARGADQLRAAQHRLGRDPQLVVVEVLVRADDHDVGAGGERRAVEDPQPGFGDVVDQRLRADHVRRAAPAAGEQELERGADRHDLGERGLEAEPPQLAHEVLGGVTDVVGEEQHATRPPRAAR